MTNIKRFLRLDYSNDVALDSLVKSGSVACSDSGFLLSIQAGDGIVLAKFNERNQAGEVRALGIVKMALGSHAQPQVEWVKVTESLYPNPQGMKFWRQPKPYFIFAKSVIARYRLSEMFQRYFGQSKSQNSSALAACTLSHSGQLAATPSIPAGDPTAQSDSRGGYVYLIRSSYGYKIGKTKRMKERTRLFSVKLPFEIEIVHYQWFDDYSRAETLLHQRFKNQRLDGEWFRLNSVDIQVVKDFKLIA